MRELRSGIQEQRCTISHSSKRWAAPILISILIFVSGCAGCSAWDSLFNRDTGIAYGWQSGDGGYTVELPNNRILWLFGDTFVRDQKGNEHMPRNTIGIHPGRPGGAPPDKEDMRFYARDEDHQMIDITFRNNIPAQPIRAWALPTGWLWPKDGVMIGDTLVIFYAAIRCTQGDPPGCAGDWNWERGETYVVIVDNPEDDVMRWNISLQPMDLGKDKWGCAVYYEEPYLYLFGVDENSNGRYLKYFVDNSNVSTYSDWIRLGVTNCIAKNLPTEFSVDKVTINGVTRYMLVHQRIFFSYDAVVRASESLGYWPDDVRGQNVWIGDLRAYDRDLTGDKYIWALKGHTELAKACDSAMADFTAPSCHDCMLISYYSQQLGRLRFICFPLYKIAPWCPALDCAKASLLARRSPE